jgi:hypothetical protein
MPCGQTDMMRVMAAFHSCLANALAVQSWASLSLLIHHCSNATNSQLSLMIRLQCRYPMSYHVCVILSVTSHIP